MAATAMKFTGNFKGIKAFVQLLPNCNENLTCKVLPKKSIHHQTQHKVKLWSRWKRERWLTGWSQNGTLFVSPRHLRQRESVPNFYLIFYNNIRLLQISLRLGLALCSLRFNNQKLRFRFHLFRVMWGTQLRPCPIDTRGLKQKKGWLLLLSGDIFLFLNESVWERGQRERERALVHAYRPNSWYL